MESADVTFYAIVNGMGEKNPKGSYVAMAVDGTHMKVSLGMAENLRDELTALLEQREAYPVASMISKLGLDETVHDLSK